MRPIKAEKFDCPDCNANFKDIKTKHDYKHWLKITGNREKALKAYCENTRGFCCYYAEVCGIK